MARIKSFKPVSKTIKMKGVKDVNCEYYSGCDENGVKYIALCTTGEKGNGVNQTLHVDANTAKTLTELFKQAFSLE